MFYDLNSLSMSADTVDPVLVDCDRTTAVYTALFWQSDISKRCKLDPDKYGIEYILGFMFEVETYSENRQGKEIVKEMVTKPLQNPSKKKRLKPNGLPSELRYGFKTKEVHKVLSNQIIGYRVYCVPTTAISRHIVKTIYPDIDPAKVTRVKLPSQVELSKLQTKRKKYSAIDNKALGFPDGQRRAKTKHSTGGQSKIKGSLGDTGIFSSRIYLLDQADKPIRDKEQFFIEQGRYIYRRINLQDKTLVARFITVRGSITVEPLISLDNQRSIDLWAKARDYGLSKVDSLKDKLRPVDIWREQTEKAKLKKQLRYFRAMARNEGNTTEVRRLDTQLARLA